MLNKPQTLREHSAAYASGSMSPVDTVEWALDNLDVAPHAFTLVTADRARQEAAASEKRWRDGRQRGALDGAPAAVKDLFDVAGTPTSAGSLVYKDGPIKNVDAPVVNSLSRAGVCLLGKTNLTEFAYSGLGINPHFGTPPNAYGSDKARIPGGSSSGAAIVVAKGLVPVSLGTDTAGSVRIPAAMNGLVGFKPSSSYYDRTAVFPLSTTLDSVGILARCVDDVRLIDAALKGRKGAVRQPTGGLSGLLVFAPEGIVTEKIEPAVAENYETALRAVEKAGATVVRCRVDELDETMELISRHGAITGGEAAHIHRDLLASEESSLIDPRVLVRLRMAQDMRARDLVALLSVRDRLIGSLSGKLGPQALIAYPTVARTAPTIAELEESEETYFSQNALILRNTMIGNYLDMPGITLPSGIDGDGLPTGILFATTTGREASLLTAAVELEAVLIEQLGPVSAAEERLF
ncbi:amidase family protein [Roseibium sp. SCP14]|uniref:amidase family protein n=1 Tax=Roseibium sp. SCP14 TaxID=3141375 RepID=UPI003339D305